MWSEENGVEEMVPVPKIKTTTTKRAKNAKSTTVISEKEIPHAGSLSLGDLIREAKARKDKGTISFLATSLSPITSLRH